jgi:anti-sigma regulatory factor (Ser/Thr protein kinase)
MDVIFPGDITTVIHVEESTQIGQARRAATLAASACGFDEADTGRVALVVTELATNLIKHATRGDIHIARVPGKGAYGVEVIAIDRGPGFNLADCLPDGFSTGGTRGEGLGAVRRQAQVMDIHADERGAVVLARMYPKGFADADIRFGASQHALHDETECGDGWAMALGDGAVSVVVVDGLGHGPAAHVAAEAGIVEWRAAPSADPTDLMASLNVAMTGTRGGAVALARFDTARGSLRYAGIGNIAGYLLAPESSRGLASHPGIVGARARRAQAFDFPEAAGRLLVLHSDGLQSRWHLADYPGLAGRHPAVITALLHRDFSRGRDDVTVFAIRLEASR